MRLSKSWTIALKDFKTFGQKRTLIYSILVLPILLSILLSLVTNLIVNRAVDPKASLAPILPAFTFFYVILAGVIPTAISSYTIVGEKVEKTLEPLLATPVTDSEILLGKGISAFVPSVSAILGGSVLFMILADLVTHGTFGYYYFPNWRAATVLLLMVPLASVMSVEWNVIVSSRMTDVRVAQQVGALVVIPFAGIYVLGEVDIIQLGVISTLLVISGIMLLVDVIALFSARTIFQREEILTKWK